MTIICCCDDDTCDISFLNNRVRVLETLCGLNVNKSVIDSVKKIQHFYKSNKKTCKRKNEKASTVITKNYKRFIYYKKYSNVKKSASVIQRYYRVYKQRNTLFCKIFKQFMMEKKKVQQLEVTITRIKKNNKYRFQNQNRVKNNLVQTK